MIGALVRPGKSAADVEGLIAEEIARINAEPVTEAELQKVRSGIRRGMVSSAKVRSSLPLRCLKIRRCLTIPTACINTQYEAPGSKCGGYQKAAKTYFASVEPGGAGVATAGQDRAEAIRITNA